MSNDILDNQLVNGSIIVTSRNNSGTLQADAFPGTIGAVNPLVAESAMIREKSSQRIRGAVQPTGLPCSCKMFTSKRGASAEATCATCGGYRA
jgi:hypothetical protein